MQQISATEFQNHQDHYLAASDDSPLAVQQSGKPIAVIISPTEYEQMQEIEDLYWLARVEAAEKSGEWVGHDEAIRLLTGRLAESQHTA